MQQENLPYIVSSDIPLLMPRWANKYGYTIPKENYFLGMASDLACQISNSVGSTVDVISHRELSRQIQRLAGKSSYDIISLDRAYVDDHTPGIIGFLDNTRAVDENLDDLGLRPRPGCKSLDAQIGEYAAKNPSPVALLDDVIFTGVGIMNTVNRLDLANRPVKEVIVGIGIKEGVDKLRNRGINVKCVREYDQVIDEVCERDFVAAVPMSGRTVITSGGQELSAPYFYPFGNPEKWASIPSENCRAFSLFCLTQSIALWQQVEKLSCRYVSTEAVPRKVVRLKSNRSVVESLKEYNYE